MAVLLAVGIADVAGASGRVAGPVLFMAPLPACPAVFPWLGVQDRGVESGVAALSVDPDSANPDAQRFTEQRLAIAGASHISYCLTNGCGTTWARAMPLRCRRPRRCAITALASIIEEPGGFGFDVVEPRAATARRVARDHVWSRARR